MRKAGATDVTPWEKQASHATLNEDLNGFNEMAVAFPLLFLSAAGVAAYVLLSRRILQERPIIGTLMAAGASPRRVMRHYLTQGLVVGPARAPSSASCSGLVATSAVTSSYASAIGVPDVVVSAHPWLIVNGLAFGVVVGVLGALAPSLRAAHTAPAEAMRSTAPATAPGPWSRAVARMTRLPATTRMALRDVGRSRRRTLATMLGSVLALVLVLATLGMMTSMIGALNLHFDKINKEDATVTVDASAAGNAQADARGASRRQHRRAEHGGRGDRAVATGTLTRRACAVSSLAPPCTASTRRTAASSRCRSRACSRGWASPTRCT